MPSDPQVNILLVDDQPANLLSLEATLAELGQNLVRARSGREALDAPAERRFRPDPHGRADAGHGRI